ncbi:LCP family protein [Bacillaceae bacterium W0354]
MVDKRKERKLRKRRRRRKTILSIILVLFLSSLIFVIYEYNAGKNAAEEEVKDIWDQEEKEKREEEFQGTEQVNKKQTNVLILGEDSDKYGISRTDTIMIGQYDEDENRAKLVSIMRDTYVNIPGHGYNKINAAFAYGGPELLRQTIEENFGIDIHYYAIVNFQGFERIVDTIAPDGIEIEVEKRMYYFDNLGDVTIDLQPGLQKLNGENLLDYARFRADSENDFGRVRRQQQVMSALKDEIVSFTSIWKIPRAIGTIVPYVDTNMSSSKILSIATDFLMDVPDEIETMRIPVDGSWWDSTYEHAGAVLEIDEQKNIDALHEFLNVEDKEKEEQELGTETEQ